MASKRKLTIAEIMRSGSCIRRKWDSILLSTWAFREIVRPRSRQGRLTADHWIDMPPGYGIFIHKKPQEKDGVVREDTYMFVRAVADLLLQQGC